KYYDVTDENTLQNKCSSEVEKAKDNERESKSEGQLRVCKEKGKRYGNTSSNNKMQPKILNIINDSFNQKKH
ncbi:16568_t:CDS:1, partial [Acaulospora morrowiae]